MTAFLVKLDENLSRLHVELLRGLGYEADRVHDQGLSGASDELVWQRVSAEGRFLITLDLDFSDVRRYVPGSHPGILLVRARNNGREAVLAVHNGCFPSTPSKRSAVVLPWRTKASLVFGVRPARTPVEAL